MESMLESMIELKVVLRPYPPEKAKLLKDWTKVSTIADISNRDFEADRKLQTRTRPITRLMNKRTAAAAASQNCTITTNESPVRKKKPTTPIYTVTPIRPQPQKRPSPSPSPCPQFDTPKIPDEVASCSTQFLFDNHDASPSITTRRSSSSNKPLYQPNNSMLRPLLAPILKDTQYDHSSGILPERLTRSRFKNSPARSPRITTPRAGSSDAGSVTSSAKKKKVHFAEDKTGKGGDQGDYSSQETLPITNGTTKTTVNSITTVNGIVSGDGALAATNKLIAYNKHNTNNSDLNDLIPPDIEMFGYNNADFGDKDDSVDSDSISTLSSDGSFYSCDDDKVSR